MYSHDQPPLSRASLVIGLYAAMALVGLLIAAGRGNPDLYCLTGVPSWWLLAGPAVGVAAGLLIVLLTQQATRRYAWAKQLHNSFKDLLGPLTTRDIVILAAASSIGEEVLFRGALMPWLGLWVQAAIFACLHVGPGKKFAPWTLMALAMGVGFGLLARYTENLGAPIAAHFMINFLNLKFIVRTKVSRTQDEKLLRSTAAA